MWVLVRIDSQACIITPLLQGATVVPNLLCSEITASSGGQSRVWTVLYFESPQQSLLDSVDCSFDPSSHNEIRCVQRMPKEGLAKTRKL